MVTLTDAHISFLRDAFAKLLGNPAEGTMAYVRCLTPDVIAPLCAPKPIQIPHWEVYAVGDSEAQGEQFITADQAVDLREEKKGNVLLLVDQKNAGAGMDGIYSAVREVGEQELFDIAINIVCRRLPKHVQEFVSAAYQRARHLGRVNTISPWREFDFYARCALKPEASGEYIALLGLWPMQTRKEFRKEDLEISAQIVERLLIPSGAADTAQACIESLLLPVEAEAQVKELEKFLRGVSDLRWTDAAVKACEYPSLWLGILEPGFVRQELKSIALVLWRSKRDAAPFKCLA